MREFGSFGRQEKILYAPQGTGQPSVMSGLELGEIDSLSGGLMKYRADIRLLDGQILKKVRLPGPFIGILGFISGFKFGYRTGQMVAVGFLQNRRDNPIVLQVYPFAAEIKGRNSLMAHSAQYDTEETSVGHESGHRMVWAEDKIQHKDKLEQVRFVSDVSVPPTVNSLEKAAQGETLKAKFEELIDKILALTVPTALGPSGTAINSSEFVSLRATLSEILSEIVKHY